MTPPTISCNVVDRRSGLPAAGISVLLRCLNPQLSNCNFHGETNAQGYILEWSGHSVPEITLLHFLFANNGLQTSTWQMGFLTTKYFQPAKCHYLVADVNFVLSQGEPWPHITLLADLNGYGASIGPLMDSIQRPIEKSGRGHTKFSKDQNKALMAHFVDEPYPNSGAYGRLSQDLKVPREKTMRWFRNRRAEERRKQRSVFHEEAVLVAALETALEVGCFATDNVAAEVVDTEMNTSAGRESEAAETDTAPKTSAAVTEPVQVGRTDNEKDMGNTGTVFVKMGDGAVRRSRRQAGKATK